MNKYELIRLLSSETGVYVTEAERTVSVLLDLIERGLQEDGEVKLINFGIFRLRQGSARWGRNPQTGERIRILPRLRVSFLPSKRLRTKFSGLEKGND